MGLLSVDRTIRDEMKGRLTCTESWMNFIQSDRAEQHSHTERVNVCDRARYSWAIISSAMIFCGDKLAKAASSEAVNVRAKSSGPVASNRSLINEISASNGRCQSIRGLCTYVRRNRIANTQSTLRIPTRFVGYSRNKR